VATAVLEAGDVAVRRGRRTILSHVDLALGGGEAVHLVGPNGSGKTSLLRVLAGLNVPAAGTLRRPASCAYVPEKVVLSAAMRPGEWLRAMRGLRRLDRVDWSCAALESGLEPEVLDRPSATLSQGMLQRIALLEAVHAGAVLLLLDEPFTGLDVAGREWLATQLRRRADAGAAVVLTDHSADAAALVDLACVLQLAGGRCERLAAASPARPGPLLVVRALDPAGRAIEREVARAEVDDVLRDLLAAGCHIGEVRPVDDA